ncbi:hypothetical protein CDL12_06971 [Handroanthus impetiginosus]|uniref:SBP-type domain-containing protein n=1 Tax=Handroanthus impetiginosus TaxID=429701 RepID=A0A2G9HS53_9LAMI|nr:hypothetical protein CDL12_06971 [Handroanthus impetiginosus]
MEPLSYGFEGRGLLFTDDTDFQDDGLMRSRNLSKKWDAAENVGFVESVLPVIPKKSVFGNQFLESFGDEPNDPSNKSILSTSTVTLNSLMEFSCSMNKGNDENLPASREAKGSRFSLESSVLSTSGPSASGKRARTTNLQSQTPTCQVHGCNKDLSSSKDYHKRHKVCDVHSKTAVVIVNGIKQRFCQQCSRFHVLAEFDEGKRSCRKSLAGHNQRRRKPHFDSHLGSTYFTTDSSKTSLFLSEILPGGFFGLGKLGQNPSGNFLNSPLSVPESLLGSNSNRALSLLSAHSQNLSSYSANSLVKSMSDQELGFKAPQDELSQEPNASNSKNYLSSEGVNTVDLIELSLHLQRVEQLKYSAQVKLEGL